jgi:hypothetical protein
MRDRLTVRSAGGAHLTDVERFAIVACALAVAACAHRAGSKATEGAMERFAEKAQEAGAPGERPLEAVAGAVVDGAIRHLGSPEHLSTLTRIVSAAAGEATDEVSERLLRGLVEELGPDGRGELSRSIAATVALAAAEATDAALRRVLPECSASDPRCLDRRVEELSLRAGTGLVRGFREPLRLGALSLALLAGFLTGLLLRRRPAGMGARRPAISPR